MILYALACDAGHRFESWFRDSGAFDDQVARRMVTCPVCQSSMIAKSIMAPAVVGSRLDQTEGPSPPVQGILNDEPAQALRAEARAWRDKALAGARDVGTRFSTEARRMHDGEIPHQPIHGKASLMEARNLIEDGIMVLPIPALPDEWN